MIAVNYGCRLGNHLFQYVAGRLLAEKLGLALRAEPLAGFPRTHDEVPGRVIAVEPAHILEGPDPFPPWPNLDALQGKQIAVGSGFVHSRYFIEDRDHIRPWLSSAPPEDVDPDDVLVNVRLGDFMPGRACPLGLALDPSYYDFALSRMKFKRVHLMTDDPNSPYLECLAKYKPVIVTGYGAEHFMKALAFKKIVMSNSTFCWWFTFASSAREIYLPMVNGDRLGSWCTGHLLVGIDLRLDLPEVTHVYNIPNFGPNPCPPLTDDQRTEAVNFSRRSRALFLPNK
jgi:hypothetical protein